MRVWCHHAVYACVCAEGLKSGLDFEQALSDPDMVELVASPQVSGRTQAAFTVHSAQQHQLLLQLLSTHAQAAPQRGMRRSHSW